MFYYYYGIFIWNIFMEYSESNKFFKLLMTSQYNFIGVEYSVYYLAVSLFQILSLKKHIH